MRADALAERSTKGSMDDAGLVDRARGGDLEALEQLLVRHQASAYTAALRLLGQTADAEDVLQETLVRGYTRLGELETGAAFGGWLRRIAVHLSLNVLRRRGQIHFESLDGARGEPGSVPERDLRDEREPTPEEALVAADLRTEVELLVRSLPADQRVAVVLRDMYDYDVAEIAAVQRCGISAAKMRIVRGRARLRQLIEGRHG